MTEKFQYWAEVYIQYMQQYRPSTYEALLLSGELESTALGIQAVASDFYQRQKAYYISLGDSAPQADIQAESDTKREYILVFPDEADMEDDLFADDFDDDFDDAFDDDAFDDS